MKYRRGLLKRKAGISNALAVTDFASGVVLPTLDQVTFDHHAENCPRPGCHLRSHRLGDVALSSMVLQTIPVGAVDHQRGPSLPVGQAGCYVIDMRGIVVWPAARPAAQDHMAVLVAVGLHNCDLAVLVNRQEVVATGGGLTQRGTEKGIRVHRKGAEGKVQVITPIMDDRMQDGDVVYVRESLF